MPRIFKFKERIETSAKKRGVKDVKGPFITMILPILVQVLQGCLDQQTDPVEPQPVSSKATPKAWETAAKTKAFAIAKIKPGSSPTAEIGEYKKTVSNKAAREVMKKQRKAGDNITKEQATEICLAHLDQARLGDLEENALKLDETKSV